MAYTSKMVNGVKVVLTAGDQTALAARDAADWTSGPVPGGEGMTTANKISHLAQAFGLTVAELKTELATE